MTDDQKLTGILVALVTPFTADGRAIDEDALHALIERLLAAGVHGFVPAGTTGEFTTMTTAERRQLIELIVAMVGGRAPVVAGTGALSTSETVELSAHAAQAGADAVMIVPPFYDPLRFPELLAFLEQVSGAVDVPIVYYNLPGVTGLHLTPAQIGELGSIDRVDYLKDTSGDAVGLTELLTARRDEITAFNGWDTLTFTGLALGATGSVWGAANLIPELAVHLWETLAVQGDLVEARRLWAAIWPVCDLLESHNYVAAIKAGLDELGWSAGPTRPPILPLAAEPRERLAALLHDARQLELRP
jgi:dihydrodipicolinate synthase/N-acetylneuraminate lyase